VTSAIEQSKTADQQPFPLRTRYWLLDFELNLTAFLPTRKHGAMSQCLCGAVALLKIKNVAMDALSPTARK
jgi:hypothetical protein